MFTNKSGLILLAVVLSLALVIACGTAAPQEEPGQAQPVQPAQPAEPAAPASQDTPTPVPQEVPPPAAAPEPVGELVVATRNLRSGAGTPRFCTAGCAETVYLASIMENLTGVEPGPGGPLDPQNTPLLAKSWEISPNLDSITFQLQEGVEFHDVWGELTAEDVAFSYNDANAAITPDSIHGQAGDFAPFIGELVAEDQYTVRMDMNLVPMYAAIPLRLVGPFYQSAGITSKRVFDELGPEGMRETFIGSGPFKFVQWRKDELLEMEALSQHWRKVPAVKHIRILDIPESSSRTAMIETGEAAIAGELPFKDVVRLQRDRGFQIQRGNGYSQELSVFMAGNFWDTVHPQTQVKLERPQIDKPWVGIYGDEESMERARKVRWALAMAIDREAINQTIVEGVGEVCHLNQISINQPGWQAKWEVPFDPERARQLLAEAGYEDGMEVDMWIGPSGINVEVGDAVAGLWLKELNVTTNLDRVTYTKFRPTLVQRTANAIYMSGGDEGKTGFPVDWPKGFQGSAWSDGGWGPGFEDPFYAQFFSKMNAEQDAAKRLAMAEEYFDHVHHWMLQPCIVEVPWVSMYNPDMIAEWSPHPSQNGNMSGVNSLETVVMK